MRLNKSSTRTVYCLAMTEGTPYPPQQPGQPNQPAGSHTQPQATPPPGGYPPPQTPPPAAGYPPQQQYPQPGQQYPHQAQPYQGTVAQPPKKSNLKKILLIVGLIVGLPLIGVGACTFLVFSAVKAPVDESNALLALLDEGKYSEAYDAFDSSCASDFTAQDIRSVWESVEIDTYDLKSSSVVNSSADVSGTISLDGGAPEPISFTLNKRDGDWKVCSFSLR